MPELPEVETIRRGLLLSISGEQIKSVRVLRPDSIAHPRASLFSRKLKGYKFIDAHRRGKYLILELTANACLIVHLRMSGRLLLVDKFVPPGKFLRVQIILESGRELRFEDMRVFGRLWFKEETETLLAVVPALAELGLEPLHELNGRALGNLFKNKSQPVKSALLDQRLIAGIGNIYADESLFQARIHPQLPAGHLTKMQSERLAEEIRNILIRAIELKGSSVRNYTDSEGINGNYQLHASVYGRTGKPCRACGNLISRLRIGGRSAHFCPICQKIMSNR